MLVMNYETSEFSQTHLKLLSCYYLQSNVLWGLYYMSTIVTTSLLMSLVKIFHRQTFIVAQKLAYHMAQKRGNRAAEQEETGQMPDFLGSDS